MTTTQDTLAKRLMDAARRDSLTQEDRVAIGAAIARITAGAAPAAVAPQGERQWICPTRTVADLVNNLLTMDQALPIYGAQYIERDGRRCAIAVPPTVSRERVKDGRWIGQGEELNAAVVWTRAERPAAAAPALEAPAAPARIVADALIRLDAIYREHAEADCDEPPRRPDWLVTALHLAAAAPQAPAAPAVDASAQVARDAGFNHGVCLALQIMASAGNAGDAEWTELLDCAGREEIMHYARHVETESWLLCGFAAIAAKGEHAS